MSGAVVVEDMANGLNEWRNISEVVRLTFKHLVDTVRAQEHTLRSQAEAIARVERLMEQKANRSELQGSLAQTAQQADIHALNRRLSELNRVLDQKADGQETKAQLDRKADLSEVADQFSEFLRHLDAKANIIDVEKHLDVKANAQDVAVHLDKKADRAEVQVALSARASTADVQRLSKMLDTKANLVDVNALLDQVGLSIQELGKELQLKADAQDVVDELDKKVDAFDLQGLLDQKANIVDVNEGLNRKANKETVAQALGLKADRLEVQELADRKAEIEDVNAVLAKKADVDLVTLQLNTKASKSEVAEHMENKVQTLSDRLLKELYARATTSDVEQRLGRYDADLADLQSSMLGKADEAEVKQIRKDITADRHEVQAKLATRVNEHALNHAMERMTETFRNDIKAAMSETTALVAGKVSQSQLSEQLKETMSAFADMQHAERLAERADEAEATRAKMNAMLSQKANKNDIDDILEKMERLREATIAELEGKLDLSQFDDFVASINASVNRELQSLTVALNQKVDTSAVDARVKAAIDTFESNVVTAIRESNAATVANLQRVLDETVVQLRTETHSLLDEKVSATEVANALNQKADKLAINNIEENVLRNGRIAEAMDNKAGADELRRFVELSQAEFDEMKKMLVLKANVKDVVTLLDMKANVEDVNTALSQLTAELDHKATIHDMQRLDEEQARVITTISSELMVARWLWKSGKTKAGHGVPWNVQSVNSAPDNFLWEKDKVNIITMLPGLYEITFGFFARQKPAVQLLVNGEPVLSAVNSASYVLHHSSGRLTSVEGHPAGNVTGLTLIDFVALPAKARIALSFKGEEGAEGFLGLRKL